MVSSVLIHPTVMMRREPLLAVGGYRPLFDGAEDYDLWLRLSAITELDNLAQPWLLCRRHDNQVSTRFALRQARRSALALISDQLRQAGETDPFASRQNLGGWRPILEGSDSAMIARVRALTAAALVDNGGSLRPRGSAYFRAICKAANRPHNHPLTRRIALACVRHQLRLLRVRRWREALACLFQHWAHFHLQLLQAYFAHARVLWRS